jgi:hypothetical protein
MVRYAKDPMRMYNYWQTAITEKIALAPKSPFIGTTEQFKGLEHIWNKANQLNVPYLPYNPDPATPGVKPERQRPADINQAEIIQAQQSIEDIKATIGIFDASLGAQGNETSGRAIMARQREGDTATFAWIDNLSRAIEHTGRILIDLIPRIYDTQRAVRILGEDGSDKIITVNEINITNRWTGEYEVLNDLSVGKYDVRVTVGPSYATRRIEAADSMMQFVQAFPAAGAVVGDLIAKSMDWPGAEDIAKRLKAALPPELADDEEELTEEEYIARQEQAEQARLREQEAYEIEKAGKVADIEEKLANAQKTMADIRASFAKAAKDAAEAEAQEIENDAVESGMSQLIEQLSAGS